MTPWLKQTIERTETVVNRGGSKEENREVIV